MPKIVYNDSLIEIFLALKHEDLLFMTDLKVEKAVEDICKLGCRKVNKIIDDLASNRSVAFMRSFNRSQRTAVLNELTSIMSIYDQPCDLRA